MLLCYKGVMPWVITLQISTKNNSLNFCFFTTENQSISCCPRLLPVPSVCQDCQLLLRTATVGAVRACLPPLLCSRNCLLPRPHCPRPVPGQPLLHRARCAAPIHRSSRRRPYSWPCWTWLNGPLASFTPVIWAEPTQGQHRTRIVSTQDLRRIHAGSRQVLAPRWRPSAEKPAQ